MIPTNPEITKVEGNLYDAHPCFILSIPLYFSKNKQKAYQKQTGQDALEIVPWPKPYREWTLLQPIEKSINDNQWWKQYFWEKGNQPCFSRRVTKKEKPDKMKIIQEASTISHWWHKHIEMKYYEPWRGAPLNCQEEEIDHKFQTMPILTIFPADRNREGKSLKFGFGNKELIQVSHFESIWLL